MENFQILRAPDTRDTRYARVGGKKSARVGSEKYEADTLLTTAKLSVNFFITFCSDPPGIPIFFGKFWNFARARYARETRRACGGKKIRARVERKMRAGYAPSHSKTIHSKKKTQTLRLKKIAHANYISPPAAPLPHISCRRPAKGPGRLRRQTPPASRLPPLSYYFIRFVSGVSSGAPPLVARKLAPPDRPPGRCSWPKNPAGMRSAPYPFAASN